MNKNLTIETYRHINSTLATLRNAIMYINHDETVEVVLKHHDAMQRVIDSSEVVTEPVKPPPHERVEIIEPPFWRLK
jgi:hypothetical protein